MKLFEFDKTKPFNRGKFLKSIWYTGNSCRIGHYKNLTCYAFITIKEGKNFNKILSAKDLNVKAFTCSIKHTQPDTWETLIIGNPEGMIKNVPLSSEHTPMINDSELRNYVINL